MKKEFTDDEIDKMMRTVVCDASADDVVINEVASSPTTWWAIQREINAQKEGSRSPWPPANVIRRWLLVAVPAAAAVGLVLSFAYFRSTPRTELAFQPAATQSVLSTQDESPADLVLGTTRNDVPANLPTYQRSVRPKRQRSREIVYDRGLTISTLKPSTEEKPEIKTDFIALTYARDPESGQIVRVKVPSSMMVSLGIVSSVNKPGDMVDAEVVVGDDGLTRAIRFIR